jgi:tetratricopeptide (TPR) repeat protein
VDAAAAPVRAGLLAERLGWYLSNSGSAEAVDAYQHAVDLVPTEPPSAARARVLGGQALALNLAAQVHAARVSAEEALRVARLTGARQEEGWALLMLGTALLVLGEPEAGQANMRQARRIAEELGDIQLLAGTFSFLPQALDAAGRLDEALAEMLEGIKTDRRLGLERSHGGWLAAYASSLCFRLGRWDDADRYSQTALATARMPDMAAMHVRIWRAELEIERGEFASAVDLLEEAEQGFSHLRTPQFAGYFWDRAALAIWQGRLDDARAAVEQGLDLPAGAEEELWFRSLLTFGLRAEADRAEQARARRAPAEAETARQVGAALLVRLRQLPTRTACPCRRPPRTSGSARPKPPAWQGSPTPSAGRRWPPHGTSLPSPTRPPTPAGARRKHCSPSTARGQPPPPPCGRPTRSPSGLGRRPCEARSNSWPAAPAST